MTRVPAIALCLSATELAAAEPSRLCNVVSYGIGSPIVELVLSDDRVFVGLGVEEGGGDLVTLREPGRFAQTWARLRPDLSDLASIPELPQADAPYDMLEVHFTDDTTARWIGTGPDNPVSGAISAFGMEQPRTFVDHAVVSVDADHPIFTDPCGDWP